MQVHVPHGWDLVPADARALQDELRGRVECSDRLPALRHVAGVDVGYPDGRGVARAAIAVLDWPGLQIVDRAVARRRTTFPYVPGLLAFRELPAVVAAFDDLDTVPDLVLCDGQGIAHPRRFGVACHLGLLIDRPTIGVGKTRLIGVHAEPGPERGSREPLTDGQEVVGTVLRTRTGVRPLYISPGHRVSLATAAQLVLDAAPRYRLPEPIRQADRMASRG